eukprot:TRINITY_DN1301_c0_g1_i1.p1 TRINITY_DN1301_c0_g1~~TRINITY_DN1301_c0_g1_i1.p1  ORF type:complete len:478 (-),score=120.38 TRINITY_DN1301_c0_g1_i1:224-1657(-)
MQQVLSVKDSIFDTLSRQTEKITGVVMGVPETVRIVVAATNNEQWGPTGPQMREVAELTLQQDQLPLVMQTMWDRIETDVNSGANWRIIYKTLLLLDYIVKNGSEGVVNESRQNSYQLKALTNVHYIDNDGVDRGVSIRERAKQIVDLLCDTTRLRDERRKAKMNKDKYGTAYGSEQSNVYRSNSRTAWDDQSSFPPSSSSSSRVSNGRRVFNDEEGDFPSSNNNKFSDDLFEDEPYTSKPQRELTPTLTPPTPTTPTPTPIVPVQPNSTSTLSSMHVPTPLPSTSVSRITTSTAPPPVWDPFGPRQPSSAANFEDEWEPFNPRPDQNQQLQEIDFNPRPQLSVPSNNWGSTPVVNPPPTEPVVILDISGGSSSSNNLLGDTGKPLISQSTFVTQSQQPPPTTPKSDPWSQTKLFDLSFGAEKSSLNGGSSFTVGHNSATTSTIPPTTGKTLASTVGLGWGTTNSSFTTSSSTQWAF